MIKMGRMSVGVWGAQRILGLAAALALTVLAAGFTAPAKAVAADPAVVFMAQVGRELTAAARSHSPSLMASVIQKYADVSYIGLSSLGSYRSKLASADRPEYYAGMVRWMARYAAGESPKYPIARVEWVNESQRGGSGIMVDCTVTLANGSSYDVRWVLSKQGNTYKVRDASVYGFWMTSLLTKLFEDYVSENGGSVRALTAVLNR